MKESNKLFKVFDELCFKSKNLYNSTLYYIRQEYIKNNIYTSYYSVQKEFQRTNQFDYKQLPAKVAQYTMRLVDQNFRSFFASLKDYKKNSEKYKGKPKLPKYLDSIDGRFVTTYTSQAISKKALKDGFIVLSGLPEIKIKTKVKSNTINQVRIVPQIGRYVVEVIYTIPNVQEKPDNGRYASIDLGINNLATITTNLPNSKPTVIDGRKLKSINHYYNKRKAILQSKIPKWKLKKSTKRLRRLETKRINKVNDYFHRSTRYIVNHLVSENICTLVIGNNKGWKQDTNLGKTNNQNFVQIPFYRFIEILKYKCRMEGIKVEVITEEYTSKCSFLDSEDICKHDTYKGKRITRGLFKSSSGRYINADVNGSYNILRKCKPGAFSAKGVQGVVVHPHILCFA